MGFFVPLPSEKRLEKNMTEYSITGIRYQMGEGLSLEELTEVAKRYVAGLKKGQQVLLMAEPENPMDSNAIAAYIDYERIGYIDREETHEVFSLLDENHQCEGVVERTDGHLTLFISIPGASDKTIITASRPRILPESPLGENVRMPYMKNESTLQLIAPRLSGMGVDIDNVQEAMRLAERYVTLLKLSVCHDDMLWMNKISKNLNKIRSRQQELEMSDDDVAKLTDICNKVRKAIGDMHRSAEKWSERVFANQLNRLRNDKSVNSFLYKKYCHAFLNGKVFEDADRFKVVEEHDRLCEWLKGMKWSELRNPHDLETMGLKVNYLGLSRQELYELFAVLLLIERLEEQMEEVATDQEEIIAKLKPIFYGDEEEACNFLQTIQTMKPKQITDKVNQLVKGNVISDMSRKRDLWKILNDYGLYTKSESNWNSQVA